MSGHSKWANIKNRKGAADKKRGEEFSKVAREILAAIRLGGGNCNPEANSFLKTMLVKAREVNMPKENVERLLANFEERRANLSSYTLEGYGPHRVPIIVEVESDNKNRILTEIKLVFRDNGGSLGESNSVMFLFERVGEVEVEELRDEDELELIDRGATDFDDNVVICKPELIDDVKNYLGQIGRVVVRAESAYRARDPVLLKSEEELIEVMDLIKGLEDNEDVVKVYAGFDYGQEI